MIGIHHNVFFWNDFDIRTLFEPNGNYQGLNHQIIEPGEEVGQSDGEIECYERFGGLLNYYYRKAA